MKMRYHFRPVRKAMMKENRRKKGRNVGHVGGNINDDITMDYKEN